MDGTVNVKGLRELQRALKDADGDVRREVRSELRRAGDLVRDEARARFTTIDARSAAGYRTRVRQRGVAVEQSLRRTTGQHPEFGGLQLRRALLPALDAREDDVVRGVERALERAADSNGF